MIFYNSYNNLIYDNVIALNEGSYIYFRGASNNQFFRNDITENNGSVVCWYCTNIWDKEEEGNYWSNYNGTDPDGDGIGNTHYSILTLHLSGEDYDYDKYPLMTPSTNINYINNFSPTPTPSTEPTPAGPPPIRFYNPYLILYGSTLLLIALGILAYFKKYRK